MTTSFVQRPLLNRSLRPLALVAVALLVTAAASMPVGTAAARAGSPQAGIHKIKHVVVVMQENRSFDEYFGTYPGAAGLPTDTNGNFTSCVPNPRSGGCDRPFHDTKDVNVGGPHDANASVGAINGGAMDGFVGLAEQASSAPEDVMGYKIRTDIPNYWAYADNYVLHDHMFASVASWSLPTHLSLVSGWTARC